MRSLSRSLSILAASAALAGSASAADVVINDLRGHVGFSITDDLELSAGGTSIDGEIDTLTIDVQYVRSIGALESWGGFIIGGDLFYADGSGDFEDVGLDIDTTAMGVNLYAGYAYAFAGLPLHLEANPYLGFGTQNSDFSAGPNSEDDDDTLIQYGLRFAGYYTFANRWQAGLELRYLINSTTEPTIEGQDLELENSGVSIHFGGGYRF